MEQRRARNGDEPGRAQEHTGNIVWQQPSGPDADRIAAAAAAAIAAAYAQGADTPDAEQTSGSRTFSPGQTLADAAAKIACAADASFLMQQEPDGRTDTAGPQAAAETPDTAADAAAAGARQVSSAERAAFARAARRVRRRRRLWALALALSVLAAAGCIGIGRALRQLSGRMARLEAAAASQAELLAEEPAVQAFAAASEPEPTATPAMLPAGDYAGQWPQLTAEPLPAQTPPPKTVYLTFDDGPSRYTEEILDTMAAHGAAGTWFVVGTQLSGREDLVQRICAEGHALALHSNTHEYNAIYASPSAFLADQAALSDQLAAITGQRPGLLRFAGGSVNHYDAGIYQELAAELLRRGLRYYDWNVSAEDAVSKSPGAAVIAARVIDGVRALNDATPAVVLMHDTKATTPAALPEILDTLSAEGYTFAALDSSVPMVAFGYSDNGGTAQ